MAALAWLEPASHQVGALARPFLQLLRMALHLDQGLMKVGLLGHMLDELAAGNAVRMLALCDVCAAAHRHPADWPGDV